MNEQEQRIAIAEACGWKFNGLYWMNPTNRTDYRGSVPDYLNDLNAMHGAEKVLTEDQKREYRICLFRLCDCYAGREVHATAAQRAEAFLKTIGKWEEIT